MGKFISRRHFVTVLRSVLADSASPAASSPPNAECSSPISRKRIANGGQFDASMERHAPHLTNPFSQTTRTLRRHEALHHELRPLSRRTRPASPPALQLLYRPLPISSPIRPIDPEWPTSSTPFRTGIRTPACLRGKNSKRAGYMEDHQLRLAHGKAAPRRAGVLEDEFEWQLQPAMRTRTRIKRNTKH